MHALAHSESISKIIVVAYSFGPLVSNVLVKTMIILSKIIMITIFLDR